MNFWNPNFGHEGFLSAYEPLACSEPFLAFPKGKEMGCFKASYKMLENLKIRFGKPGGGGVHL